jgi:hypothetical protein
MPSRPISRLSRRRACVSIAFDTSPQCAPARGSIFAGRNPVDIGITRFAQPANLDVRYFTDILRLAAIGWDWRGASTIWAGVRAIRRM